MPEDRFYFRLVFYKKVFHTLTNLVLVPHHVAVVYLVFRGAILGCLEDLEEKGIAGPNVHTETNYYNNNTYCILSVYL